MISLLRKGNSKTVMRIIEALSNVPTGQEGLRKLHSLISSLTGCDNFTGEEENAQQLSELATLLRMIGPFL